jgi:hypothetical protein
MDDEKFSGGETYEEWAGRQYDGLEFRIIQEIHNIYPNWSLGDIKTFAPEFMANHLKIVKKINDEESTLNMKDIEERAFEYVTTGIMGNRVHIQVFGKGVPKGDHHYLAKWIMGLGKILDVLINGAKYKTEDERGHASVHTFRFNGFVYGFRSEMEFDRDVKELVELNRERFGTKSDLFKELIFKGISIYSIINKGILGERAKDITNDVRKFQRKENTFRIRDVLADIDDIFKERYDTLKDIEYDKEALEEFRDDITEFISDELDRNCSKQDKAKIKNAIMKNRDLSRILDILEDEGLVSKTYVESILDKGVAVPYIDIVSNDDTKNNGW